MNSLLGCRRGQFFGSEVLAASLIFLVVLSEVYILWNTTLVDLYAQDDFKLIEPAAIDVIEQLLRTPGKPQNWSIGDVQSLGLASESRVLDEGKLKSFVQMMDDNRFDNLCNMGESNYDCNRGLMGLGSTEFKLEVFDLNDTVVVVDGVNASTGRAPTNETLIMTLHRTALLDNQIVRITMRVWK